MKLTKFSGYQLDKMHATPYQHFCIKTLWNVACIFEEDIEYFKVIAKSPAEAAQRAFTMFNEWIKNKEEQKACQIIKAASRPRRAKKA
jgi:hypothetical protein